jgi:hydrogenase nickel incorporation protein HypA/HybF
MHEMAITEHMLATALRHAEQAGAARITRLNVVVGEMSSVVDDSVQFYWDFVAKGTIAEGAVLHFERIPARLACRDCGAGFGMRGFAGQCPACQGTNIHVVAGDEFQLQSIEVEEDGESLVKDH